MIYKFSMQRQMIQPWLAFIIVIILTIGCENEESSFEIGEDLIESKTKISMIDSFTVKLSTIQYDSIPTSGTDMLLIGKYQNDFTGEVKANTYFNFDLSDEIYQITEKTVFDSITISLRYADYQIGDSTEIQNIAIHRLTNQLELHENDLSETYLFNTSQFPHEEVPVGTRIFHPYAYRETLEIRLDDDFGEEIIQLIYDETDEVSTDDKFNEYLKGFVIKSSNSSGNVVTGFLADSIFLNLYTHIIKMESEETNYQFPISGDSNHYNQISSDRSETPFYNLLTQREELNSSDSDDMCFLHGGSGTVVRIDFPSLNDVFMLEDVIFLRAELVMIPLINYTNIDLPESLYFYETDKINKLGDQASYTVDSETYYISATLNNDEFNSENKQYIADITPFISGKLVGNFYDTNEGLLLSPSETDFLSTIDHVVFYGENASKYKPSLNLYFLTYE